MGRWLLRLATIAGLAFLYIPIGVIVLYAFNAQRVQVWPIQSYSLEWFGAALDNASVRDSLLLSIEVGLGATIIALVLGTLAAVYGWFVAPIGWRYALLIWAYALAWFLINDRVKLAAYRIFDPSAEPMLHSKGLAR